MCICLTYCLQFRLEKSGKSQDFFCLESGYHVYVHALLSANGVGVLLC